MSVLASARPRVDTEAGDGNGDAATPRRNRVRVNAARVVLLAATVTWLVSLPSLGRAPVSQYGLLAAGSPLFVISIGLTVVGFLLALRAIDFPAAWAGVLLSIATLRLTVTLATSVPFYSWTYKHIAVADYIQHHGAAARDVDIYNHWDGLFAATAWLSEVTGVSATSLAHWFTPAMYLIEAGLFYAVARIWRCSPMVAVTATFLLGSLDWVGQSYYSPQCAAYILAIGVVGLFGIAMRAGRASKGVLALILGLFVAITITHQLTPYWLIILCAMLTLTGRLRPRWLTLVLGAVALGFLMYNWSAAAHFGLLSGGNPVSNAQTNVPTIGVDGQRVTSAVVRALSGTVWLVALAAGIRRLIAREPAMPALACAFSSFAILFGQGYGGEAVFRVFLFSLPGCALLIAPGLERLARTKYGLAPLAAVGMAACIASAQGLFGPWSAYRMASDEVALSTKLMQSPVPTYITAAAPVWPERNSERYVEFARWNRNFDETMVYAADLVGSHFKTAADYRRFMTAVLDRGNVRTYLVITTQMQVYDWYFGILPFDAIPNLQTHIDADPRWAPYYLSRTVHVYRLTGTG